MKAIKKKTIADKTAKEASDVALRQNYVVLNPETMQNESRREDIFQLECRWR